MAKPIFLSFVLFAASFVPTVPKPADDDPIARLDECIQHRFLSTRSFGMSRILPNRYHGIDQFQTENAGEKQVVADLKQEGYQVAVFLAGRHVLDSPAPFPSPRYGLQGPALITGLTDAVALPEREALLAVGRDAMRSFVTGYEVKSGDWVVAVRALRATNETCITCHTSGPGTFVMDDSHRPKLGDALGVAIYVYRR